MDRSQLLLRLDELLELPPGTLSGPETLASLENWDSLAVMNFIALANETCGKVLSARQLASSESINDLLNLLEGPVA